MDDCLTLTVIIRGPAYRELISQLSAVADSRDRAGLLKRLAEDGTRVSGSPVAVMTGRAALSDETGSDVRGFDIRLVIRQEEFPSLLALAGGRSSACLQMSFAVSPAE
jgi:hypothetical protein